MIKYLYPTDKTKSEGMQNYPTKREEVTTCRALLYDMRANSAAACIPPNSTAMNPQAQVKTDCGP